jgi:hypothetical protein
MRLFRAPARRLRRTDINLKSLAFWPPSDGGHALAGNAMRGKLSLPVASR